jgi:hypothetical protein
VFCHSNLKRFAFEKLSSNSFKSQRWWAFMITASGNSHHWRSLKWPACGKGHCWRLPNVTSQWWPTASGCLMWPASGDSIYIYTRRGLENFLSLARKRNDAVRLPNFPTERRLRPRPPPSLRLARCPPGVPANLHEHPTVVLEGPAPSPRGPPPASARAPPLLPWTTAALSSTVAPPTDDLLPERHRPSSLPGWRPPPCRPLPRPPARNRRWLLRHRRQHHCRLRRQLRRPSSPPTPHHLTTRHAWRPGMGPAAQQRQPRLGWFFFFFPKCNYMC